LALDMYEDRSFRTNFLVGLLTIAVVAGLAVVVAFFLAKERPLAQTYAVRVRFADVAGLKSGAPVTLQGAGVGRVESLHIDGAGGRTSWVARLAIRDEPWIRDHLTTTSSFSLVSESVFGNRYVNATFGDAGRPLVPEAEVEGIVGAGIDARTFEKLSTALENLSGAAAELKGLLAEEPIEPVLSAPGGSMVEGPSGATATAKPNLRRALGNLDNTLSNASAASTALKEALSEENQVKVKTTFDDLSKAAANLANVTERMKSGMDSWAETMEKMRFWRGWFGGGDDEKKKKEEEAKKKGELK
jgi:ABC-type transporter Mla subunit MlaD